MTLTSEQLGQIVGEFEDQVLSRFSLALQAKRVKGAPSQVTLYGADEKRSKGERHKPPYDTHK